MASRADSGVKAIRTCGVGTFAAIKARDRVQFIAAYLRHLNIIDTGNSPGPQDLQRGQRARVADTTLQDHIILQPVSQVRED